MDEVAEKYVDLFYTRCRSGSVCWTAILLPKEWFHDAPGRMLDIAVHSEIFHVWIMAESENLGHCTVVLSFTEETSELPTSTPG